MVLVPAVVVGLKRRAACRCEAVRLAGSGGLYVDEDGALNTDPHPAVRAEDSRLLLLEILAWMDR